MPEIPTVAETHRAASKHPVAQMAWAGTSAAQRAHGLPLPGRLGQGSRHLGEAGRVLETPPSCHLYCREVEGSGPRRLCRPGCVSSNRLLHLSEP